jgi:phenylacetate-coenzyme A ligase PaaK-like adenylate-forming protein
MAMGPFSSLDAIVSHTVDSVPAYKHLAKDWSRFPIVTKREYRAHYDKYLSEELPKDKRDAIMSEVDRLSATTVISHERKVGNITLERSSGTTGPPVWYPRSHAEKAILAVNLARTRRKIDPEFAPTSFGDLNSLFILSGLAPKMDPEETKRVYLSLVDRHCQHLYGHLGLLHAHATMLHASNTRIPFRVIETTGDYLDQERASNLKASFGCKIWNQFGTRETWALGYSTDESSAFDLLEENIVELIDDQGRTVTEFGVLGSIVVTSTIMRLFPIIRFSIGEAGCWKLDGSTRKLLLDEERITSKIVHPNGQSLSGNKTLKRLIESVRTAQGAQVMRSWKVRKEAHSLRVFIETDDMVCADDIKRVLQENAHTLGMIPIEIVEWQGWQPFEKRILYVDRSA